jgi:hypothetical protein
LTVEFVRAQCAAVVDGAAWTAGGAEGTGDEDANYEACQAVPMNMGTCAGGTAPTDAAATCVPKAGVAHQGDLNGCAAINALLAVEATPLTSTDTNCLAVMTELGTCTVAESCLDADGSGTACDYIGAAEAERAASCTSTVSFDGSTACVYTVSTKRPESRFCFPLELLELLKLI